MARKRAVSLQLQFNAASGAGLRFFVLHGWPVLISRGLAPGLCVGLSCRDSTPSLAGRGARLVAL